MTDFTRQQLQELLSQLAEIDRNYEPKSFTPDIRLTLISSYMETISLKLKNYVFSHAEEEIIYFKSVLPQLLGLFVYYTEIFGMETCMLIGTPKAKAGYLQVTFEKIDDFFQENGEFFRYYRFGKTHLDDQYFLRDSSLNRGNASGPCHYSGLMDFPVQTVRVATLLVYTRLETELRQRFGLQSDVVSESAGREVSVFQPDTPLVWTDTKNGLVELIYSLKEIGAFNHGKASVREITEGFEKAFSVNIGNPTRTFQELSNRKISTTLYLDEMKAKFLARTDRNDDRHMQREAVKQKTGIGSLRDHSKFSPPYILKRAGLGILHVN